jgi:hypothetical protein
VKLFKGRAEVVAVETPNSLFDEKLATFMKSNAFNQNASAAFTEIYTMQMRMARETERYALISIGSQEQKQRFLPMVAQLAENGFVLFATEGTHAVLQKAGVPAVCVYKVSDGAKKPNLLDLLKQNRFDLIVNVMSPENNTVEVRDGTEIRKWSVINGVQLVSEFDVLKNICERLQLKVRKKSQAPLTTTAAQQSENRI